MRRRTRTSAVGPSSTICPQYITAIRSQAPDATPRSWVMSRTATSRSCCSSASNSITRACTVASSAVVGSSAIRTDGSHASAMAIMTRWAIPPLKLNGISCARRSASGIRTRSSISTARAHASFRPLPRWRRTDSAIWPPTDIVGFRLRRGCWKIMPMSRPRIALRCLGVSARTSVSPKRTLPATMWPPV